MAPPSIPLNRVTTTKRILLWEQEVADSNPVAPRLHRFLSRSCLAGTSEMLSAVFGDRSRRFEISCLVGLTCVDWNAGCSTQLLLSR
jgi:hypothetical protein